MITIHIVSKSGKTVNCDVGSNPVNIDGRLFASKSLQGVSKDDIERIVVGIYNRETKKANIIKTISM